MGNKWSFPINTDDSQMGISDSGIETFREDMYSSLARETCQNSMDAKLKDRSYTKVVFQLFYVNQDTLQDHETLIDAFHKSKAHGETLKNSKTIDFFRKALKVLRGNKIPVLRISDFNTTGLTGSNQRYGSDTVKLKKGKIHVKKGNYTGCGARIDDNQSDWEVTTSAVNYEKNGRK